MVGALAMRETVGRSIVIVMNLLQYIRCHDRVPPSRVTVGVGLRSKVILVLDSSGLLIRFHSHPVMSFQVSVCSDIDVSCLEILSERRAIERDSGVFFWLCSTDTPIMEPCCV